MPTCMPLGCMKTTTVLDVTSSQRISSPSRIATSPDPPYLLREYFSAPKRGEAASSLEAYSSAADLSANAILIGVLLKRYLKIPFALIGFASVARL